MDPSEIIRLLEKLDRGSSDTELDAVIAGIDAECSEGRGGYNTMITDLFKQNRGAFRPHVGGLDDIAIVDGAIFAKQNGAWDYTGADALDELRDNWCPQDVSPVVDLYEFTASVDPALFVGFCIAIDSALATELGKRAYELTTLGETEVEFFGKALRAAWGAGLDQAALVCRALLTLDGTMGKVQR
jgi:hypothetical protein